MRTSKVTEERIAFALRQADLGAAVDDGPPEDGRQPGDRLPLDANAWGVGPSELRRLRQLEEENRNPRRPVADLRLDKAMPQEVLAKRI